MDGLRMVIGIGWDKDVKTEKRQDILSRLEVFGYLIRMRYVNEFMRILPPMVACNRSAELLTVLELPETKLARAYMPCLLKDQVFPKMQRHDKGKRAERARTNRKTCLGADAHRPDVIGCKRQ